MDEILYPLLALAIVLAVPGLSIAGFVQARRARREVALLRAELALLRPPPAAMPAPEEPAPAAPAETAIPQMAAPEPPAAPPARASLEESLTARWLVWLGGVALALGGGFLVKWSIDAGLLSPPVRVLLGLLLAAALVALGERLRRRAPEGAASRPDYIPAAVTAAGLCTAFASLYAAYALYDMLGPALTFAGLGAVAFAAIALSLAQGPLVAALGVAGAYVVPLLVSSDAPSAWPLFAYLFFVAAAGVGAVRYRGWRWLAWLTLAGAALWPLLWAAAYWQAGDAVVFGLYLLPLAALFLFARPDAASARPDWMALTAAATVALLAFVLVRMDRYGAAGLVTLAALALLYLSVARRDRTLALLAPLAALLVTLVLAAWHQPSFIDAGPVVRPPVVPPELLPFALACLIAGAGFAAAGFVALWGAARPGLWAGLSAATPLALLTVAYGRLTDFGVDLHWSLIGLGLAALSLLAAQRVGRYRSAAMDEALGAYAVGVSACLAFAATAAVREAALTVMLALELAAVAWVYDRLRVPALRVSASVIAAAVLIRLLFNQNVLDYPLAGAVPGLNWLLYGYGVPALAFHAAARLFRRGGTDALVLLLEAGALAFAVLLVTLEIRSLIAGGLAAPGYGLLEQSVQSIAWGSIAYALFRAGRRLASPVAVWGWRILAALAAAQVLLLQCLADNPLWSGAPVGTAPVFDLLLLAYGAPGALAVLFVEEAHRQDRPRVAAAAGGMAMLLILLWLSLEIRHWFQGGILSEGEVGEAELYAYSAGWLLYAGGLLALGLWRGIAVLRYASLAIVLLTVLKVFLLDMAALEGIFRVLSFLGLGAALVGTGLLYQRFVFPAQRAEA